MTRPVRDEFDIRIILAHRPQDVTGQLQIGAFLAAADIVNLVGPAFFDQKINSGAMIVDKKPVAALPPFAVNRHRIIVAQIGDEKRNDFLGIGAGAIRVGGAGDDNRQMVGLKKAVRQPLSAEL